MAFDAFLQIDDVKGEATAEGMEGAIEIMSFSWGASNPTNPAGGGMGSGKVSLSDFNIMKKSDKASNTLFAKCCNGTHFDTATVSFRKAGGVQEVYLEYKFEHVFVTSIQWSGSSGGDDVPTESDSFAYKKVTITYHPQDEAGKDAGPDVQTWDVSKVAK